MSPAGDLAGRKETEATLGGDSAKQKTKTTRCETEVVIFSTWRVAVSHQGRVREIRKLPAYDVKSAREKRSASPHFCINNGLIIYPQMFSPLKLLLDALVMYVCFIFYA